MQLFGEHKVKLGLAGIGLMGLPLAERILKKYESLNLYNRTKSKLDKINLSGSKKYSEINSFIKNSDTIILMLSDYDAIKDVLFKNYFGVYEGKTIIQMSTIAPVESQEIGERICRFNGEYIEAPVLGSIPQIINGELIVLVGSNEEQFNKWKPLFSTFSNKILRIGNIGDASAMKLALNQLIVSETVAFSMSLGYLREMKLNIDIFMEILRSSSLYAPTFDKKLGMMIQRDFENPNFPLKHLLKDVDLILGEFGINNINTNSIKGIRKILIDSINKGYSEKDYSVFYNTIHPAGDES